jgi:hypothetical protein
MLLGGAVAVAIQEAGKYLGLPGAQTISLVLIVGSALMVAGAVVVSSIRALQAREPTVAQTAD